MQTRTFGNSFVQPMLELIFINNKKKVVEWTPERYNEAMRNPKIKLVSVV